MNKMKSVIKWFLRILFKDYELNRIYFLDLQNPKIQTSAQILTTETIRMIDSQEQFSSSSDQRIRSHAWYLDKHAYSYGIYIKEELVSVCTYWISGHKNLPNKFSKLNEDEVIMVDLLTKPECRGKGYALAIINYSINDLSIKGYKKLWTWVWYNNTPSIRAFSKADWVYSNLLLELQLYGMKNHLRIKLPAW